LDLDLQEGKESLSNGDDYIEHIAYDIA
jgi:hypothetical protein